MQELADTFLPDTDTLEEKYPVYYPTPTASGKKMEAAVLRDFENYNRGYGAWSSWADEFYAENGDAAFCNVYKSTSDKEALFLFICRP